MASCRVTFELLPPEMREHILNFLDRRSLLTASTMSKAWYRAISPVTAVWSRACQSLRLQVREGIDTKMCRALFVRIFLRSRSIEEFRCLSTNPIPYLPGEEVTAVYYYNGKLAISSRCGRIALWTCPTFECKWISARHSLRSSWATAIKFDDDIVLASYSDGSLASWNCLTGRKENVYFHSGIFSATVDFLTDANLVVSAQTYVACWNMSRGNFITKEHLEGKAASRIVVKPYPTSEVSETYPTVRKMLIASIVQDKLMLWVATSTWESGWGMNVTMTKLTEFRTVSPLRGFLSIANLADELHFDGTFLYFAIHFIGSIYIRRGGIGGLVCQLDVTTGRVVNEFDFPRDIRSLVGVGEKYIMLITTDEARQDQLEIVERQSSRIIISYPIVRYPHHTMPSMFCLVERSWLDGFDGDNDSGAVCIFVTFGKMLHVVRWSEREDQRFLRQNYSNCLVNRLQLSDEF